MQEVFKNLEDIEYLPVKIAVELPQLIYPEDEKDVLKKLTAIKRTGIVRGVTGNIGGISLLKKAGFKKILVVNENLEPVENPEYVERMHIVALKK